MSASRLAARGLLVLVAAALLEGSAAASPEHSPGAEIGTPTPPPPEPPRWPWIGPTLQVATIYGASTLAIHNGLAPGRYALDALGASLGASIGMVGGYLLAKSNMRSDPVSAIFLAIPVAIAAGTLGGLALGEVIWSDESPLPKRTVNPAFGGMAVGAVIDIGALLIAASARPTNETAGGTAGLLAPFTIGACAVAGYSINR